ncbi:MAG TPA: D-2-hydroxyacid dehydrogenase [Ktedonobacteraceae bacterium]|nr:D-2-hydroxyacid dehydrogenase [Ktedonobacteraceae bacterium]
MSNDHIVLSTFRFTPESQELLRDAAQAEAVFVTRTEDFLARLPETEVLCAYSVPNNLRELASNLRWLQFPGAGVDNLRPTGLLNADSGIIITTASGIHAHSISEYVFGSMLMFNRSWPEMVRLQDRHRWPRNSSWYNLGGRELVDQTLGIIGLGSIGRQIAHLGKAFGMRVIATRRSAGVADEQQEPEVDRLYPIDQLHEVLQQSDYVVLAVPLTPETEGLIGESELRAMRRTAYLVNIARGKVIDEDALIRALREQWIAGAGLDVTAEEPLPSDSPLYAMPNVILTPHISGESVHYERRLAELFADNLRRYRAGQPLRNQYDPARGY